MNYSQSIKPQFSNLQSTHIPTYGSIRDNLHPNQMRVSGRYGERQIPGEAFLAKNKIIDNADQKATYQYSKEKSQQAMASRNTHLHQVNNQQAHYQLPLYTYGHQCQPCTPQPYMLPVYYEEPMQVRQQWQRPLDPHVHQQEWRFVKTQDKGGIVKYVTRDEQMVETVRQSQWQEYYNGKKLTKPPIITPQRQTKTCCTPVLFALLGFLALLGLILGLVLLLSAHQTTMPKEVASSSRTYVDPTPGQINEQIPAVPIAPQPVITTKPVAVTRPTFTQAITSQPTQTVQTSASTTSISKVQTLNTSPVSISYGYQTSQQNMNGVDYNNDYQVRPGTQSQTVTYYTTVTQPTNVYPSTSSQTKKKGNYQYRVPQGYRIDETGMIVPI